MKTLWSYRWYLMFIPNILLWMFLTFDYINFKETVSDKAIYDACLYDIQERIKNELC
jgi:hypothetical protein